MGQKMFFACRELSSTRLKLRPPLTSNLASATGTHHKWCGARQRFGPAAILLFINEIGGRLSNERCVCKLYADDVKLYTTLQINEDCAVLQQQLDALYTWSATWQLSKSHKNSCTMQMRALQRYIKL